jgi:hypothetical protein
MELLKSKAKHKKWAVRWQGRLINFGDDRYEDYTQHHDKQRREDYWRRHSGDGLRDPSKPGFWAARVLWGEFTDIDKCFRAACRVAERLT